MIENLVPSSLNESVQERLDRSENGPLYRQRKNVAAKKEAKLNLCNQFQGVLVHWDLKHYIIGQ